MDDEAGAVHPLFSDGLGARFAANPELLALASVDRPDADATAARPAARAGRLVLHARSAAAAERAAAGRSYAVGRLRPARAGGPAARGIAMKAPGGNSTQQPRRETEAAPQLDSAAGEDDGGLSFFFRAWRVHTEPPICEDK